ncbi:MAG: hypothetical protein JWN57_2737 [Frankiales bacterium]|jgi:acyl-coenzyme A thioesterase PaaI-like protein|nr:hypothetical protein [Frankiales bacterium]
MPDSEGPAADGVARLRRWHAARGVPPAVGRLRMQLLAVELAATTVRMPLHPELLLPGPGTSAAVPAALADVGLTTSVVASLPSGQAVTTIAMTVDHLLATPASGALVATCRSEPYAGGAAQHAVGLIHDDTGRRVAAVSGWFLPAEVPHEGAARTGLPTEPPGADLLELLQVAPAPPVEGALSFPLHARDALGNVSGTLHGGVGALTSSLAAEAVLGSGARLLTSTYAYLRPIPRDAAVTVSARVLRRGRRTASVEAVLVTADGREALRAAVVAAVG